MSNKPELFKQFSELDYMTQRTIQYEFPTIFPECGKQAINTKSIDHFPTKTIKVNDLAIAVYFVIGLFCIIAKVMAWLDYFVQ